MRGPGYASSGPRWGVRRCRKMTMSQAETEGFGADVRQLFVKERAALKKGHVDVDGALEEMERLEKEAVAANAEEEAAKRAEIGSTERSVAAKHRYYVARAGDPAMP